MEVDGKKYDEYQFGSQPSFIRALYGDPGDKTNLDDLPEYYIYDPVKNHLVKADGLGVGGLLLYDIEVLINERKLIPDDESISKIFFSDFFSTRSGGKTYIVEVHDNNFSVAELVFGRAHRRSDGNLVTLDEQGEVQILQREDAFSNQPLYLL